MKTYELPKKFCFSVMLVLCLHGTGSAQASPVGTSRWSQFVHVEGQPELIPVEWVATPEGKFAHSTKIPNPLPKESGYRKGMTSQEYFAHLCQTEAGEFIFKTIENVEGLYFMRPPKRPTDADLKDRYKLEAPEIERTFQLRMALPQERAKIFVNPPWALFTYVEEPNFERGKRGTYLRSYGYEQNRSHMIVESVASLKSRYGLVWRGIRRPNDRELGIAGSEWIVLDLKTQEVLSVQRNFGLTGKALNTPEGIWWLNALNCSRSSATHILGRRIYNFAAISLKPSKRKEQ